MARDSMQPWIDRISLGELEVSGVSPRSAFGAREWDGHDASTGSRAYGGPANPDSAALPGTVALQVQDDPHASSEALDDDDFDFTVASY